MFHAGLGHRDGEILGLQRINSVRLTGCDVAKSASARANVTQDHYRGVLPRPALTDIWTGRLLADRVKFLVAHERAGLLISLRSRGLDADPLRLSLNWIGRVLGLLWMAEPLAFHGKFGNIAHTKLHKLLAVGVKFPQSKEFTYG